MHAILAVASGKEDRQARPALGTSWTRVAHRDDDGEGCCVGARDDQVQRTGMVADELELPKAVSRGVLEEAEEDVVGPADTGRVRAELARSRRGL